MLSRRQLRSKVLQALYAFFQSGKSDLAVSERELLRSVDKVYDLYLLLLLLLVELADADQHDASELHTKFFPKAEELNATHRIYQLKFIQDLRSSNSFNNDIKQHKLSWQKESDLVRKIFLEIKKSNEYREYLLHHNADEKEFLVQLIKNCFVPSEALASFLEESNLYWLDDFDFICHMIIKTIKSYYTNHALMLFPLYKDDKEDKDFTRQLFVKTILHSTEFEKSISEFNQSHSSRRTVKSSKVSSYNSETWS